MHPRLPPVLEFMQLLWAIAHGLEKTSKRMSTAMGVTGPQRLALRVIGLFPGASAGDVAAVLHVHPSTLTGVLQRLVDQGLLRRKADKRDRRRAVLELTAAGRRANAHTSGTVEAVVAAVLRNISDRERETSRLVLDRLAERLNPPRAAMLASRPAPSQRR